MLGFKYTAQILLCYKGIDLLPQWQVKEGDN